MSRQAEERKQNRTIVRGAETENEVDYVSQPRSHNKEQPTINQPECNLKEGFMKEASMKDLLYFWCGRQSYDRKCCPARDTICTNCNKKGRFQSVFLSKKPYLRHVHAVEGQEEEKIHLLV